MSNKPMSDDPKFRKAVEYAAKESSKEQNKLLDRYDLRGKIKEGIQHWKMLSDIRTGCNWNHFVDGLVSDIASLFTESIAQAVKEEQENARYKYYAEIVPIIDELKIAEPKTDMVKSSIEKAYPEAYRLARRFHEFYEQSAPAFGYITNPNTREFYPNSNNGRLMAWVCYEIVKEEKQELLKKLKAKFLETSTIGQHTLDVLNNYVNGLDLFDDDF